MKIIRKRIVLVSYMLLTLMLFEVAFPKGAWALTSGPAQPEMQSFTPVGSTDMVDIFTGDFKYNIPLMDVDGYPLNLSYQGGISIDQEASWVGLGWNLNPGAITRNMRGLPDDFQGDLVDQEYYIKPNRTIGLSMGLSQEIFGKDIGKQKLQKTASVGLIYNNYNGASLDLDFSVSGKFSKAFRNTNISSRLGLNVGFTGEEGIDITPNIQTSLFSQLKNKKDEHIIGLGSAITASGTYNSRRGMKELSLSAGATALVANMPFNYSKTARYMYGLQSWMPEIKSPMRSFSFSFQFATGKEFFGFFKKRPMTGTYSSQWVSEKEVEKKAYGYMYLDQKEEDGVFDLNRENDVPVSEQTKNYAIPVSTFDFFNVSGHGISGTFRAHRNDVTNYHAEPNGTDAYSVSTGFDWGATKDVKLGLNLGFSAFNSSSENWDGSSNKLQKRVQNVPASQLPSNPEYEPYFFKDITEHGISNIENNPTLNAYYLLSPDPSENGLNAKYDANKSDYYRSLSYIDIDGDKTNNIQVNRQPRNKVFWAKTAAEASKFGFTKEIEYYALGQMPNEGAMNPFGRFNRVDGTKKEHHISEVEVINSNGARYIYGIPVYNLYQKDITFSVGDGTSAGGDCNTGLTTYSNNGDFEDDLEPKKNTNGQDHMVQSVMTPGYAHSYLLTAVLSPDYVDVTGDGVSDDDLGSATRLNYSKTNAPYMWRTPTGKLQARYNEGKRSDFNDDKASVSYGEKELWYVHSIEGKNHIAMFYISARDDGRGVEDPLGGDYDGGAPQYKLDSVVLYNKQDFLQNGVDAYKIKGVHFTYAYKLCGDVPNYHEAEVGKGDPNKGKLTLESLHFTYGTSYRTKHSPYTFTYHNENTFSDNSGATNHWNYGYNKSDRWGVFKENGSGGFQDDVNLNNSEFPYTIQDKQLADEYASAWSLKEITLPSGGKISIELEADDYGYVQDRSAMSMYKILGFNNSSDYQTKKSELYSVSPHEIYNTVFIDLGKATTQSQLDRIVQGLEDIQVTVLADILNLDNLYTSEYVKCYVDLEGESSYGLVSGDNTKAYLRLKTVKLRDLKKDDDGSGKRSTNPISKAIWNWTRLNAPELAFNQKISNDKPGLDKAVGFVYELVGLANEITNMAIGMYGNFRLRGIGREVQLDKSWIRLRAHERTKFGGGHRVKSIKVSDNWGTMGAQNTGASDFEYGQEYFYTTNEEILGEEIAMSSGVASYEPIIGSDENPFTTPSYIYEALKGVPNLEYMNDRPPGESFFPAPVVGYSKVVVKPLQHQDVEITATGKTEYQFYTAKDFPMMIDYTLNKPKVVKPNYASQLLFGMSEQSLTAAQGYIIQQNDMHGKPKAEYVYSQFGEDPISGALYKYRTNSEYPRLLSNTVKVLNEDGSIEDKELGTHVDLVNDFRQMNSASRSVSWSGDIDFFVVGAWPAIIPSILGSYQEHKTEVKTAVTVKVVHRKGLLESIVAIKEGSHIATENLLYDAITGEVLVSNVQNEFEDNIRSVSYPAHWAYENGMGPAFQNLGIQINNVEIQSDSLYPPNSINPRDYFVPGDMVSVTNTSTGGHRICDVYQGADYKLNLIDHFSGEPFIPAVAAHRFNIRVIRSGRRNQMNMPVQSLTMKNNPIAAAPGGYALDIDSVISVSAIEMNEHWPYYCNRYYYTECDTTYNFDRVVMTEMLDEIFSSMTVQGGGTSLTSTCVNEKITDRGYQTDGNLYKKLFPDGDEVMVQITDDSCFTCVDSIFFDAGETTYLGLDQSEMKGCRTQCCSDPVDVESFVPNHAGFETYRTILRDISNPCVTDTNLRVTVESCNSYIRDEGRIRFKFAGCDGAPCNLDINVPNNYCFRRIIGAENVWYHYKNNKMFVKLEVELIDGSTEMFTTTMSSDCIDFRSIDCETTCVESTDERSFSPYHHGVMGNWRMKRQYAYNNQRQYTAGQRTRTSGTIAGFDASELYWQYDAQDKQYLNNNADDHWVWASEATLYDPHGMELENRDALDRYSAAQFGFNNTIPVAVAGNSKYKQMAYEGFEENNQFWISLGCYQPHLNLMPTNPNAAELSTEYAHSGNYSLKVFANQTLSSTVNLSNCTDAGSPFGNTEYNVSNCVCIGNFAPSEGTYVVSAWVKQGENASDTAYLGSQIQIQTKSSGSVTNTYNLKGSGPIVEGWQRVFAEVTIGSSDDELVVSVVGDAVDATWMDDFRFHPVSSNMKTYAYNQITLRLMAELDDNNFATFYEYNSEGDLIRIKKETERGIVTIKEVRKHIYKKP